MGSIRSNPARQDSLANWIMAAKDKTKMSDETIICLPLKIGPNDRWRLWGGSTEMKWGSFHAPPGNARGQRLGFPLGRTYWELALHWQTAEA
jgi:hypothetical protein